MVGEGPTPSEGRPNPPRILPLDKDLRWRVALASWGSASQTHQLPDMSHRFLTVCHGKAKLLVSVEDDKGQPSPRDRYSRAHFAAHIARACEQP